MDDHNDYILLSPLESSVSIKRCTDWTKTKPVKVVAADSESTENQFLEHLEEVMGVELVGAKVVVGAIEAVYVAARQQYLVVLVPEQIVE